ncbi:importin-5 [Panulirus ornatus]|uniref:importin-5 n=1 Tax=Panulirus ornatus TaxID=150431 RepID=UPI003A8C524C
MSVVVVPAKMAGDQEQFQQLLTGLLSHENKIRQQAETTYEQIASETKFQLLLTNVVNKTAGENARTMAAVLLRRLLTTNFDEVFPTLPPDAQRQVQAQLLASVQQEEDANMRKKLCDIVSELAHNMIDDEGNNKWPEFLQFLFESARSPSIAHKEIALTLFSLVPGVFGNQQQQHLGMIKAMLTSSLADSTNPPVQSLAVKATAAFILLHDNEPNIQKNFADLLPQFLQIIANSIMNGDDDALLKCLVDLAESCPKFLRPQVETILQLVIKALPDPSVGDTWKHLILEVVVTLAETAPAMVRKAGAKYMNTLIPQMLNMMTDLEDEEEWSVSDEQAEEDNDSNAVVAESSLDRLACGLGGKTVLPHINATLSQMLQSDNWKCRHAALMAISAVGEGCHKQMEGMLPQIMDAVIRFLQDPHPRVRYAACNAIGQMASDFAPIFQKKFHEIVVPGLLHVMDDGVNPRVQAHAGAALVNFSEVCPKNILTTYLPTIIAKLESILAAKFKELMECGTKLVLEQVVTTIASVADTAEEKFVEYYDRFIPCLMYIIENANSTDLRLLRGKTIECVSLIGLAVGADKFLTDAGKMMDLLLKAQTNQEEMADDDPQVSYLISAWARICKIMGKRFEPYLPLVMGPVLKTASLKPEVALLDNEDMNAVDGDDDWQFVSIGEQQNFGIRTAGLEEKATACQMLVCYARELKEGFADYTEQVVKLMVPMLKFYFHDGVRTAAAESLPFLLECAKIKGPQYLAEMWQYMCPELLKAIETEPESEVLSEHMYAMAKSIEVLGMGCLTNDQMTELIRILDKSLKEHFERAVKRQEKRKDEDYDEVVEEQLLDEDDEDVYVLSKIADITHALFAAYGQHFFPYFDALLPHFVELLGPDRPWPDHQWGLCIFDDVIEYGGPACDKYTDHFLQALLEFITDKQGEVRQAAAFGCGVLGQFAGPAFASVCAQAIPLLVQVIQNPDARNEGNLNPTENAIAAVTKILKYNSSAVNVDEVIPVWLSWLPVWEDTDEAPHVYGYLCDLIDGNHPLVLGPNNSNLPRLMAIFSEAFKREAVEKDAEVTKRMLNIVQQLQANPDMFQACISQLTQEQQVALHQYLTT